MRSTEIRVFLDPLYLRVIDDKRQRMSRAGFVRKIIQDWVMDNYFSHSDETLPKLLKKIEIRRKI